MYSFEYETCRSCGIQRSQGCRRSWWHTYVMVSLLLGCTSFLRPMRPKVARKRIIARNGLGMIFLAPRSIEEGSRAIINDCAGTDLVAISWRRDWRYPASLRSSVTPLKGYDGPESPTFCRNIPVFAFLCRERVARTFKKAIESCIDLPA